MAKNRKGKRERALIREQYRILREVRAAVVSDNLASPKPEPVKYASLGNLGRFGTRARVSQLIIRRDPVAARKMAVKKFGTKDSDHYDYSKL